MRQAKARYMELFWHSSPKLTLTLIHLLLLSQAVTITFELFGALLGSFPPSASSSWPRAQPAPCASIPSEREALPNREPADVGPLHAAADPARVRGLVLW